MKRSVLAIAGVVFALGLPAFGALASRTSKREAPLRLSFEAVASESVALAEQTAEPPLVGSLSALEDGLTWSMSHNDVIRVYNAIGGLFDREYDPLLARTQPGVQMDAVEAERENRKSAFAQSFLEFGATPTGYDATGVKDEYTYRNHESVMSLDKDGKRRFLFFIGAPPAEHLWKIYDEIPLRTGGPFGGTYAEAVQKLQSLIGGTPPRVATPLPNGPLRYVSSDWQDPGTHLRADDRSGDGVVGIVLEDKRTLAALPQLRANKGYDPLAMDPSVAAITRGSISDPSATQARAADAGAPSAPKSKKR